MGHERIKEAGVVRGNNIKKEGEEVGKINQNEYFDHTILTIVNISIYTYPFPFRQMTKNSLY